MQLKISSILIFLLCGTILIAQEGLINFQPKVFTLRNSRLQFGLNGDAVIGSNTGESNLLFLNGDNSEYFKLNSIPNELSFLSAGFLLDLYSPNSFLGLTFGGNFEIYNFRIKTEIPNIQNYIFDYNAVDARVFGGLKFQFGRIYSETNLILLPAIGFSLSEQNLSYSGTIGLQYRFINEKLDQGKWTKIWLYLKGELIPTFPDSKNNEIVLVLNESDIKLIKLSLGLAFFF